MRTGLAVLRPQHRPLVVGHDRPARYGAREAVVHRSRRFPATKASMVCFSTSTAAAYDHARAETPHCEEVPLSDPSCDAYA